MSKQIHRWVRMTFHAQHLDDFLQVFENSKTKIRNMSGCLSLQLIQDPDEPCVICTSSIWESEEDLNHYRHSDLFKDTWSKTKPLFKDKAKAKTYILLDWQS